MTERGCVKGLNSAFLPFTGTVDELKKYFPKLVVVETLNQLTNTSKLGVYVLKDDKTLQVGIFGGCPNYQSGQCSLKSDCFSSVG